MKKIGIIGCGVMGSGIARRLSSEYSIAVHDRDASCTKELASSIKGKACLKIQDLVSSSDLIILCVKPQNLNTLAPQLKGIINKKQILASIIAGISISTLRQHFGQLPIVRMMPNLAVIYGKGVTGLAVDHSFDQKSKMSVETMCSFLGTYYWLPENKIDALTALTGSGPAFALVMIESMIETAISLGFTADQGKEFVMQMLSGTLSMLEETGQHPAELKWQVASPGGITIAGLKKMEEEGIRAGIMNTFLAAYQRAQTISGDLK